ncbi:MATE family efflux transporter [Vibrio sp. M260118]|uniref:MATE family efflux transporter n=1 Tax=Vibrio sp. M260118 TaxID=3020896 RepID=UPI002F403322
MQHYKQEANTLIKLATPVLIASVAQTGMGFVDTVMAGGVSATDMAAVSIAASIWLPSILFGIGLLMAIVPVVAQLNGSGRQARVPFEIQQGIFMALLISIPTAVILQQTEAILVLMDIEPLMSAKTIGYMDAVVFAAIVYWLMFAMLLFYVITSDRLTKVNVFEHFHKPNTQALIRLFKLGFPVAAALFFEVTLFAVVALLVAPLGPLVVAAHQVAINFSSLVFMLPMSIGAATSIRVGHRLGEQNVSGATIASHVGLIVAVGLSLVIALFTVLLREPIALLYTHNRAVIDLALQLLLLAAVYQVTDAIQVVAAGALRGYKDMAAIFNRTFVAYWIFGLPLGYILAMTDWIVEPMGAHGFWVGFIIGLSTAALLLGVRLHWMHKQSDTVQLTFSEK